MTNLFANKVALITGAGSGIGLATAKRFLVEGATVVAGDVNLDVLNELRTPDALIPTKLDVRSLAMVEQVVTEIVERFGHLDILVNNAAVVASRKGFLHVSDDDWATSIEVNLLGYIRTARAVIPHMSRNGGGVIIHMASEAALMPNMALPDYSVLKSSVLNLSKIIAREFGSAGIRSNVVSPAFIRTPIYDRPGGLGQMLERKYDVGREEAYARYVEEVGVVAGRLGTPEEVAALVAYLASPEAAFITGANYLLDGGVTPFV